MHRAMHQFAPRAIRGGIYFARRIQDTSADDRPFIVGALARGPVFITPAHRQDFADRITLRLAASAVISCGRAASVPSTATRAPTVSAAGSRPLALLMSA